MDQFQPANRPRTSRAPTSTRSFTCKIQWPGWFGFALPITRQAKGYPFEVRIVSAGIEGVVLSDHVKSLDWNLRDAEFAGKAQDSVVATVLSNIAKLTGE